MARRDVEKAHLIGAGGIIGLRGLDRIARIGEVDEAHALHNTPVLHVEARDDAGLQHDARSHAEPRQSRRIAHALRRARGESGRSARAIERLEPRFLFAEHGKRAPRLDAPVIERSPRDRAGKPRATRLSEALDIGHRGEASRRDDRNLHRLGERRAWPRD